MRLQLLPLVIIILVNIATDIYVYRELKNSQRHNWLSHLHKWFSMIMLVCMIAIIVIPKKTIDNGALISVMWVLYAYFTVYIPKYFYVIISSIAKTRIKFLARRGGTMVRAIAIAISIFVFFEMWWGALVTPRQIGITRVTIGCRNIPERFSGLKIVQFSDFHLGTYGKDTTFVSEVVDSINSVGADMVVFTGDLVNRETSEAYPFIKQLSRIKAPLGVYSILGNHDYGDYKQWETYAAKSANNKALMDFQHKIGWKLLRNQSEMLRRGNDSVAIIGVENWGEAPFPKYGDLRKSYRELNDKVFKILLSHNPNHWDCEVVNKTNIDLMLAGHTHAMQMEFGLFGKEYSPSSLRYKEWGGLYRAGRQKLYVNIGLGEVAMPMRIGAKPEITVITIIKGR